MDYYNNRRYQWQLAKLSTNEFFEFYTTGEYLIDIPNKPAVPTINSSTTNQSSDKVSKIEYKKGSV